MRLLRFQSLVMATVLGLASPAICTLDLLPGKSAIAQAEDIYQYHKVALNGVIQAGIRNETLPHSINRHDTIGNHEHSIQTVNNSYLEANILSQIGDHFIAQNKHDEALIYYEQSLRIFLRLKSYKEVTEILLLIADISIDSENFTHIKEVFEEAKSISNRSNDFLLKNSVLAALKQFSKQYYNSLDYEATGTVGLDSWGKATEILELLYFLEKSLIGIPRLFTVERLGISHYYLGNYNLALNFYHEAFDLSFHKKSYGLVVHENNLQFRAMQLNHIALVYNTLGQHEKSLQFINMALQTVGEPCQDLGCVPKKRSAAYSFGYRGLIAIELQDCDTALRYIQAAGTGLSKRRHHRDISPYYSHMWNFPHEVVNSFSDDFWWEPAYEIINGYSQAYLCLGDYQSAAGVLENIISDKRFLPDQKAFSAYKLGIIKAYLGEYIESIQSHQEALLIHRQYSSREGEAKTIAGIAFVFELQGLDEIAIAFYKQSVNISESIRAANHTLEPELQQTYTNSIASSYRSLANLLLRQNRVLEAQRVLDLLKVQELDDYLRGVERNIQTESGIIVRPEEQEALERFNTAQSQLVELGRELLELEAIDLPDRTPEQTTRIRELRQLQNDARTNFQTFLESDEIRNLVAQLRQTTGATNLELSELNALQDNLRRLEQNAVVLYPLILEDRLELIIVTANAPPLRRTVSVSREDLNRGIAEMRSALQSPSSNAVAPAQQLYDWLIRPLEDDLAQANADTIIYAPDSQLRYIPLAALHDGNQWLTERFRVNNITAASIDDLDNAPNPELHILAAAFSEGQYTVPIRDRTLSFGGLEYAGREVENLSQLIPQTEKRLNEAFDSGIVLDMNDFSIVHLATHATFNPGPPEDSFILFGDGSKATLTDIKSWNFPNVELVVLSACETAVGDVPLGNGEEILGFGYLMQLAGADAAIASLWQVNDGGTQVLMNQFYRSLQQGHSKAEALRQAQISLIEGNLSASETERAEVMIISDRGSTPTRSNLSHPYYWAPFILIGNGL